MNILYSNEGCRPCNFAEKLMTKEEIPFKVIKISEDEEARELVKSLGYMQTPVIVAADGSHFGGFNPDRIKALKNLTAAA